jgi:hypothetical protein
MKIGADISVLAEAGRSDAAVLRDYLAVADLAELHQSAFPPRQRQAKRRARAYSRRPDWVLYRQRRSGPRPPL